MLAMSYGATLPRLNLAYSKEDTIEQLIACLYTVYVLYMLCD